MGLKLNFPFIGNTKSTTMYVFMLAFLQICISSAENDHAQPANISTLPQIPVDVDFNALILNHVSDPVSDSATNDSMDLEPFTKLTPTEASLFRELIKDQKSTLGRFIPDLTTDCLKLLQEYAITTSDFVYCALAYAKPLMFCEACVDKYEEARRKYHEIENRVGCGDPLLRSDRVQVLKETNDFLVTLWKKANCENCFKNIKECRAADFSQDCPVADNVLTFEDYNNKTLNCFQDSALEVVCSTCSEVYTTLNSFYRSMGDVEEICIDCVERMNSTRKLWGIGYNCTNTSRDVVSVVSISVFFCSLPIFFYVGSKIHTVKSEYKLMKQNRLKRKLTFSRNKVPRLPDRGEDFLTADSEPTR